MSCSPLGRLWAPVAQQNWMRRRQIQPLLVVVHFFIESEIEMTIDPREVRSQTELDTLLEFMRGVASALDMPVAMTPENGPEFPILTVVSDGTVEFHG